MEKKRKISSMARYVFYVSLFIFNLWLLLSLLSSCTEEMMVSPGISHSGQKIAIQFALGNVVYDGNEVVSRCQTPETPPTLPNGELFSSFEGDRGGFVIPISEDINMCVTLEVDQDVNLRTATSNLKHGTKICIVAYSNGTDYHSHANYTVSNTGELIDGGLQVTPGNYKFVAYSFNSTTLPVYNINDDTILNIDPSNDLLWGCYPKTGTCQVTAASYEDVPITMSHLFSLMKIQVSTNDIQENLKITAIENVSLYSDKKVNMRVNNHSFTEGNNAVQGFLWKDLNATTATSIPRTVYTGDTESIIVNIGSLTLSGKNPFTNLTAVFKKKLQQGISYTFKINFQKGGSIIDTSAPDNVTLFVGAFWKANQTGERLIRIPRPTTGNISSADGDWTASVVAGNDWIVLDKEMTADKNVGWLNGAQENLVNNGNDPNFDNKHRVNSTLTAVAGTMNAANPQIYFRIGLKSTFSASKNVPARYGMVLLTYKNNTQKHRIWIRQGEGSDFLPGQNSGAKWSPYNLGHSNDVANFSNRLVHYPSQAGYFYQWGYSKNNSTPKPYHPVNPSTGALAGWLGDNHDPLFSLNNTCPNGYVVPKIDDLALLLKSSNNDNYTWGYYADGWFDRRQIVDAWGKGSADKSAVSLSNNTPANVAYTGKMIFDVKTNTSIFFPAAGYRRDDYNASTAGALNRAGADGMYLAGTKKDANNDDGNIYSINFYKGGSMSSLTAWPKIYGYSLRCIQQ